MVKKRMTISPTEKNKALITEMLKAAHFRMTKPRTAILDLMIDNHGPFTIEEIQKILKKKSRISIDFATVYRTMRAFEKAAIVTKCDFGDGFSRFERTDHRSGHHHHHIVCNICRKTARVDICPVGDLINLAKSSGFDSITHSLEFFGVCGECQTL
jgi:Fur family ferric uptake transcriptional regulator